MKIKTTVEVEHEISLPAYFKTGAHQFKIYSEEKCICVFVGGGIEIQHAGAPINCGAIESTETEFLTAYNKTLSTLNQLI